MKTLIKSLIMLGFLAAPLAATAQSIVINLPRLTWPTQGNPVAKGCTDAASLTVAVCAPEQ